MPERLSTLCRIDTPHSSKYYASVFGFARSTELRQLRDAFGKLQARLHELETHAPALSASYLEAADKLARAAARLEKQHARAAAAAGEDPDKPLEEMTGPELRRHFSSR